MSIEIKSKVMVRRERIFYSKEFRERALAVYICSEESAALITQRFDVKLETLSSCIKRYSKQEETCSFRELNEQVMKKEKPTPNESE